MKIGGVSRFREGNEVRFIPHIDKWHMEAHGGFNGKINYNNYLNGVFSLE